MFNNKKIKEMELFLGIKLVKTVWGEGYKICEFSPIRKLQLRSGVLEEKIERLEEKIERLGKYLGVIEETTRAETKYRKRTKKDNNS